MQSARAFANAKAVAEAGGFEPADIGHVYVWVPDLAARDVVDDVWAQAFPHAEDRPARHTVVGNLPEGALVGVEITAAR